MSQLDLFEASNQSGVANRESQAGSVSLCAAPSSLLPARLYALGLSRDVPIELHANRRVLVSRTSRGALRVHRGYGAASDQVIAAIVRWARPKTRRAYRMAAQRLLLGFPVHDHVPPALRPSDRPALHPGDDRIFRQLHQLHDEFNRAHFNNALGRVRMALSNRMRRRLGEFRLAAGGLHEIVIGRRHLRRDGWKGVAETLLHEMVHQWQAETGRRLAHGREFRARWALVSVKLRSEAA